MVNYISQSIVWGYKRDQMIRSNHLHEFILFKKFNSFNTSICKECVPVLQNSCYSKFVDYLNNSDQIFF